MSVIVQVLAHALNVRDGAGVGYNASSALFAGDHATVDTYTPGAWLHVTAPHVGYISSVSNGSPTVQLLDVVVTPPTPAPSGDTMKVRTTDSLKVRAGYGLSSQVITILQPNTVVTVYAHIAQRADGYTWYQLATSDQRWIAAQFTVIVDNVPAPVPVPQPTPIPQPPVGTWVPPLNAALYGGHINPGGYRPNNAELAVYARNHINYVLIPAYQTEAGHISALASVGVQHFIIRATISGGWDTADNFASRTLPILKSYAAALGGSINMMVVLGNEPNLVAEGWTHGWQNGRDYASWWLQVAGRYRPELPGVKLGFAPMSPGGDAAGVRMDERAFVAGCGAAIQSADFIATHCYWSRADASDLSAPTSMWRTQFGNKAVVVTETGPAIGSPNVTAQAIQHAHSVYAGLGIPATYWIMDGSGVADFANASWKDLNITVNPNPPPAPNPTPQPVQGVSRLGLHIETSGGVSADILNTAIRLFNAGKPWALVVVIDDVGLANALVPYVRNLIYRDYAAGKTFNIGNLTSEAAAQAEANKVWANHQGTVSRLDKRIWVQSRNETGSTAFDYAYECRIMDLAKAQGRRAAIYGDSPGQPELNEYAWRVPALKQAMRDGHALVLHEYSAFINKQPSDTPLCDPATRPSYGLRHRELYASVPVDCRPKLFNAETGLSTVHMDSIEDIDGYCTLLAEDDYVEGMALYGYGASVYNLNGQLAALEQLRMRQP